MKIIIATTVFDDPSALNQPPEKIGTEWRKATNAFQFHMRMEMCKALRKGERIPDASWLSTGAFLEEFSDMNVYPTVSERNSVKACAAPRVA